MQIQKYKDAAEYVKSGLTGIDLENEKVIEFIDCVSQIVKKQNSIFSILKSPPKYGRNAEKRRRALIWHAFKIGTHQARWGDLAPWSDRVTILLMSCNEDDRELFHRLLENTCLLARAVETIKKRKAA